MNPLTPIENKLCACVHDGASDIFFRESETPFYPQLLSVSVNEFIRSIQKD